MRRDPVGQVDHSLRAHSAVQRRGRLAGLQPPSMRHGCKLEGDQIEITRLGVECAQLELAAQSGEVIDVGAVIAYVTGDVRQARAAAEVPAAELGVLGDDVRVAGLQAAHGSTLPGLLFANRKF